MRTIKIKIDGWNRAEDEAASWRALASDILVWRKKLTELEINK